MSSSLHHHHQGPDEEPAAHSVFAQTNCLVIIERLELGCLSSRPHLLEEILLLNPLSSYDCKGRSEITAEGDNESNVVRREQKRDRRLQQGSLRPVWRINLST